MTKNATKLKATVSAPKRSPKSRSVPPSTPLNAQPQFAQGVVEETQAAYSSEEKALDFLISNITDKLGGQGLEGAQMREFLSLILDTDPTLKEEILKGISVRK